MKSIIRYLFSKFYIPDETRRKRLKLDSWPETWTSMVQSQKKKKYPHIILTTTTSEDVLLSERTAQIALWSNSWWLNFCLHLAQLICVIDVVRREKNIEQSEKPESFLVICNFAFQHIWEYRQFGDNFLAKENYRQFVVLIWL